METEFDRRRIKPSPQSIGPNRRGAGTKAQTTRRNLCALHALARQPRQREAEKFMPKQHRGFGADNRHGNVDQ